MAGFGAIGEDGKTEPLIQAGREDGPLERGGRHSGPHEKALIERREDLQGGAHLFAEAR